MKSSDQSADRFMRIEMQTILYMCESWMARLISKINYVWLNKAYGYVDITDCFSLCFLLLLLLFNFVCVWWFRFKSNVTIKNNHFGGFGRNLIVFCLFEMDRMMDQFMFCKTNIIFCGPASKWRVEKKIYQKLMQTTTTALIEFQRVYRSSLRSTVDMRIFCVSCYQRNHNAIGFSRFVCTLLMAVAVADVVVPLLCSFLCVWNVIHIWSQLIWLSVNNYKARRQINRPPDAEQLEFQCAGLVLNHPDAIFDQLKTT